MVKIGTRGSPLALAQAQRAADQLAAAFQLSAQAIEIVPLTTRGDQILNKPLAEIGGKGLFTEELTAALRNGAIDMAVHSLKDLPTQDEAELTIAALLPRDDARDCLITNAQLAPAPYATLADLPQGARLGTASLRRRAQVLRARPDLKVESLRGNIGTRLTRMTEQGFDAILLAAAGLARMPEYQNLGTPLAPDDMLPAAGQGAIALQCLASNYEMQIMLTALADTQTTISTAAERAFLSRLDGSCRTPIAAHAHLVEGHLHLQTIVLSADGAHAFAQAETVTLSPQQSADAVLGAARAANLGDMLADRVVAQRPELVPS